MKSLDLRKQWSKKLAHDPGLLTTVLWILGLFFLAIALFGMMVGSLITSKFFLNAQL